MMSECQLTLFFDLFQLHLEFTGFDNLLVGGRHGSLPWSAACPLWGNCLTCEAFFIGGIIMSQNEPKPVRKPKRPISSSRPLAVAALLSRLPLRPVSAKHR